MRSIRIALPLLGGLLATQAHATDFVGNWNFDYNGQFSLVSVNDSTTLGVISGLVNASLLNCSVSEGSPNVTISQTSPSSIGVPFSGKMLGGLFNGITVCNGTGTGVVTGSAVSITGPSFLSASAFAGVPAVLGLELRLALPSANLNGNVNGVDVGNTLAFGDRAYSIAGTSGSLGLLSVQARLNTVLGPVGSFIDVGVAEVTTSNWSLTRASQPVPEPASMLIMGTGLVALVRRRRAKRQTL
jgi:hypothetical protein